MMITKVSSNSATVRMQNLYTGTFYFRVTINGVQSAVGTVNFN